MVKLVDTADLKSAASNGVPVRFRLRAPVYRPFLLKRHVFTYSGANSTSPSTRRSTRLFVTTKLLAPGRRSLAQCAMRNVSGPTSRSSHRSVRDGVPFCNNKAPAGKNHRICPFNILHSDKFRNTLTTLTSGEQYGISLGIKIGIGRHRWRADDDPFLAIQRIPRPSHLYLLRAARGNGARPGQHQLGGARARRSERAHRQAAPCTAVPHRHAGPGCKPRLRHLHLSKNLKKRPLPHEAGNGQVLGRAEMETQENRPHRR